MKAYLHSYFLVLALFFLSAGCEKIVLPDGTPTFVKTKIRGILEQPVYNPPARVYEWIFNGSKYYYFTSDCCDQYSDLYDANGTLVCHPDGGITGTGDGKCPDFSVGTLTKTLVWEDGRK